MSDFAPGTYTIPNSGGWPFSPKFLDFASFLGFNSNKDRKGVHWQYDEKTTNRIEEIYLWGRIMANSSNHEDIKETVYNLKREIGVNWIGKSLVDDLWQYIQFDSKFARKKNEILKKALAEKGEEKVENKKEEDKILPAAGKPINFKKSSEVPPQETKFKTVEEKVIKKEVMEV